MRDAKGFAATDDLVLLLSATVAFTLFFAAVAGASVRRAAHAETERLQDGADAFLAAVMDDRRWTDGHGLFRRDALDNLSATVLAPLSDGKPFRLDVVDIVGGEQWSIGEDDEGAEWAVASTAANVVGDGWVHPARVTAIVWDS